MHFKLFQYLENTDEIEILENSNENLLILKTEYVPELLIEILESEFISNDNILLSIDYYFNRNLLDLIRLESGLYIIIIRLD